ncbi:MAG: flagellar type III secretion system pore protein FliP [Candidatus Glassbacteria bacterium]|nr:flagellar type III secretion system pore protein FliP [Candidatus Glassbacteria bacterium]
MGSALVVLVLLASCYSQGAAQAPVPAAPGAGTIFPSVNIGVGRSAEPEDLVITLQLLFLMTLLALAPSILIMMTCFTRIVVVFHFLRQALGTQGMPANQLLVGLALFLTLYIMSPVWTEINDLALQPYLRHEITQAEAFDRGIKPIRGFMLNQVREKDLSLFVFMSKMDKPATVEEIPTLVIIPAFIISELRLAFTIGFLLYLPFIMIDMIVSSVLLSMGMLMLPPIIISLPFKVLLFVMVDGWYLLVSSLMRTFN